MCIIPSREIDYYWDRKLTGTIKGNIPALTVYPDIQIKLIMKKIIKYLVIKKLFIFLKKIRNG